MLEFLKNLDTKTIICFSIIGLILIAITVCIILRFMNKPDTFGSDDNFSDDKLGSDEKFGGERKYVPDSLTDIKKDENNIILFFDREGCPYSDKQRESLKANNMKLGDFTVQIILIDSEDGSKLAQKYNAQGTPTLVNPNNGNKSVGLKDNDKHLEELTKLKIKVELPKNKLHIVGREGCPFCTKMYDLCKSNNIEYDSIESNSEKGRQLLEQYDSNGVPLLIYNEHHKVGYVEISELKEMFNKGRSWSGID